MQFRLSTLVIVMPLVVGLALPAAAFVYRNPRVWLGEIIVAALFFSPYAGGVAGFWWATAAKTDEETSDAMAALGFALGLLLSGFMCLLLTALL